MSLPVRALNPEEAALLLKLYRGRKFGASHMLEGNLLRGFPPDRLGGLKSALESLKRNGIVRAKKTKHGPAVFLPPSLGEEIYEELRRRYPWLPKPPWL